MPVGLFCFGLLLCVVGGLRGCLLVGFALY